jgi:hypothetical protein
MLTRRSWSIRLVGVAAPQAVTLNGKAINSGGASPGWSYDAASRSLSINTGAQSTSVAFSVKAGDSSCRN